MFSKCIYTIAKIILFAMEKSRFKKALFQETHIASITNNNMVYNFDSHHFPDLDKSFCNIDIFLAGIRVSGRMIVKKQNTVCGLPNGTGKDFSWMDYRNIQTSHRNQF